MTLHYLKPFTGWGLLWMIDWLMVYVPVAVHNGHGTGPFMTAQNSKASELYQLIPMSMESSRSMNYNTNPEKHK